MANRETMPTSVRRLWLWLTASWSVAWLTGLVIFTLAAWTLAGRYHRHQLDAQLRIQAIAVYGLAYFDENGKFESDLLRYEADLLEPDTSLWLVQPGPTPKFYLGGDDGRLPKDRLHKLANEVVRADDEILAAEFDLHGSPLRVMARPTYNATSLEPRAAIIVATNPEQTTRAARRFALAAACVALGLGAAGIAVGGLLARSSLRPLAEFIAEREQFLAAAAHELRTPLASIAAVVESARAGNESTTDALARLKPVVDRATHCAQDLLLYARLESGTQPPDRQSLRFDLLVECCLPEPDAAAVPAGSVHDVHSTVRFESEPVTMFGDAQLLKTAVRNLISNAMRHADSSDGVLVKVVPDRIVVENAGACFPETVLQLAKSKFRLTPSRGGNGFGLATVQLIARLHGGILLLENTSCNTARATMTFANSTGTIRK